MSNTYRKLNTNKHNNLVKKSVKQEVKWFTEIRKSTVHNRLINLEVMLLFDSLLRHSFDSIVLQYNVECTLEK